MSRNLISVVVALLIVIISSPAIAITLASGGKTGYVIVTPAQPVVTEVTAAKELQDHLLAITGADFRVITESEAGTNKKLILVGQTEITKKMLPTLDWASFGSDGTLILTKGDTLVLAGGRTRGGMYAVFTFLEDVLGVRWWSHNESYIPHKPELSIGNLNMRYVPGILLREAHFFEPITYGQYAARNKLTGHFNNVPVEYGGHYSILGFCHTFYQLIPPGKYYAQHPEWFSMINGKRTSDTAQLCLTNEEMRKELVKNALALIKTNPEAGIISVTQNDWNGQCQCSQCKAIEDAEGSPSGPMIHFVNKVAEDINKEYPDFLVETLAYMYTLKTPRHIRPGKNVVIRLCSNECDYGHIIDGRDTGSKAFIQELKEWSAISNHLFVWTYVASFGNYLYPNPCLPVYGPDIRLFNRNKAAGVFLQGDAYNEATCFVRLRAWVIAHLLWNPAMNQKKLVKEFMDGYYGKAAPYLSKYLTLIEEAYSKKDANNWMGPKYILEGRRLFASAAKAVADDPVLLERVNRERIPLDCLLAMNYDQVKSFAAENKTDYYGPKDLSTTITDFESTVHKYNVGYYAENTPLKPHLDSWKLMFSKPTTMPAELGDLSGRKVVDLQETRVGLYLEGTWVNVVEDQQASNRVACVLTPAGKQWAIQYSLDKQIEGRFHSYAAVKIDAVDQTGKAFMLGMYDTQANKPVVEKTMNIEDMPEGNYKLIDLGILNLNAGCIFWFSPADNPIGVKSISVDRVLLVRE